MRFGESFGFRGVCVCEQPSDPLVCPTVLHGQPPGAAPLPPVVNMRFASSRPFLLLGSSCAFLVWGVQR